MPPNPTIGSSFSSSPVNADLALLSDSVYPVARLVLQLGVPVEVEEEEVVPAGQVQAHAAGAQGQQHHLRGDGCSI